MTTMTQAAAGTRRELRLALVCYGGVSLAIYMHGVTKEIQKLVVAAAAFEQSRDANPFPEGRSEHVWWELLRRLDEQGPVARRRVPTRVVVDIVSGTSAGGINGICLAKALAVNRWQDELKSVWFRRGDIGTLLHGPSWLPALVRLPVIAAMSVLWRRPPAFLRGDSMCRWLYEALREMDAGEEALPGRESLLPPDDRSLQLFVPTTDFHGYPRTVALEDPKTLRDVAHRHVLRFDYADRGREAFAEQGNHALAFAARATSSFPGAFSAVSIDSYARSVRQDVGGALDPLFDEYRAMHHDPHRAWFVDGGVLDNFPFASAVDAITARPASREVDRRLLFIDPNPLPLTDDGATVGGTPAAPSWVSAALNSLSTIPRAEPVIDDLRRIVERNATVLRIREIIETSFDGVTDTLRRQAADALGWPDMEAWPDSPSLDDIQHWRGTLQRAAADDAGLSYATYLRLRIAAVLDRYGGHVVGIVGLAPSSAEAALIHTVLRRRADDLGLLATTAAMRAAQQEYLASLDLSFHERSLRFLIAAFSWWYRDQGKPGVPPRTDLDALKRHVYDHIARLHDVIDRLGDDPSLAAVLRDVFAAPAMQEVLGTRDEQLIKDFVAARADALDEAQRRVGEAVAAAVGDMEHELYAALAATVADWSPRARRDLLVRYLGFPYWDILVYPVQTLSDVGELDHVEVSRVSPLDAVLLSPEGSPREPLSGAALHHFGAFFTSAGREKDYLWGRLDAAERLVTLLFDDPYRPGLQPPPHDHCERVFRAIVAEERAEGLGNDEALTDVERRIGRLTSQPVEPVAPLVSPGGTSSLASDGRIDAG